MNTYKDTYKFGFFTDFYDPFFDQCYGITYDEEAKKEIKINKVATEIESIFEENPDLLYNFFEKTHGITYDQIKEILKEKKIQFDDNILYQALQKLLVEYGHIIKKDYWSGNCEYFLLDKHRWDSSFSRHYYSFDIDDTKNKKFLLISDTHIGSDNINDFKMLDKVYDYAIKEGATRCFHLGDLFTKVVCSDKDDGYYDKWANDIFKQLSLFEKNYPHPKQSEIMTYGILGNHDKQINTFLETKYPHSDLRGLTSLNNSFYMFPRDAIETYFSDLYFTFNHRLYLSWLVRDLKMKDFDSILEYKDYIDGKHDVLISGHLHKGFAYSVLNPEEKDKEKIYLSVPSTSKINLNQPVAYLVDLHYLEDGKVDNMNIEVLKCDNDYNITVDDTINWNFREKNKSLKKMYK